jgi:hypothetical protein
LEITGDTLIEDMLLIDYRFKDDANAKPGNTAVAIASFVTAYARLKLYEEMEKIVDGGGEILYFDTDSIVFVPGTYIPKTGPFLGEMTDEIEEEYGVGAVMTEFSSLGPKTYAFKVETPTGSKYKFKTKGITQTLESTSNCNPQIIRDMAFEKSMGRQCDTLLVKQSQFRTSKFHHVTTHSIEKRFQVTSDKRRVLENDTLPYGYVDEEVKDFVKLMITD